MMQLEDENIISKEIQENQSGLNSDIDNEKVKISEPDSMDATVNVLKGYADRNILSSSHAILEIIKNSFDADAREVQIKIKEKDNQIDQIEIMDNGDGFTQEGYDSFRLVGKSNKKQNQKTALGRTMTGMNGSGAYSAIKLGRKLKISSFNLKRNFSLNKKVNWESIFKNPDEKLRNLFFHDIPDERNQNKGTTFRIENIVANMNLTKIENDLSYLSLNEEFKIQILNTGRKIENFNLIHQINEMEKYKFVNRSIAFEYKDGKVFIWIKINGEIHPYEKNSIIQDFIGSIEGKYLSIDRNILKEEQGKHNFPRKTIFNEKDKPWNLFYSNEMLILTPQNLGIDFSMFSSKERGTFGFRNSFGYTSIKDTKLIFDESRTNLTDDEAGEYQKYQSVLQEIYDFALEEIKLLIKLQAKKSVVVGGSGTTSVKNTPLLRIKVTPRDWEILDLLDSVVQKMNISNPFYPQMCYCIGELQRVIKIKNYITNWNISYHALIRVYCEILFIYKIYDFFTDQNELKEAIKIYQNSNNDFKSIGSLLQLLDSNELNETVRLKEEFKIKTNQNKLDNARSLVKKLNRHIHNPQKQIKASISEDLIRIFSNWI